MAHLAPGKETPSYVNEVLAGFGKTPGGEPLYRVIWSERKLIYFDAGDDEGGQYIREYDEPYQWLLEVFVMNDMSRAMWDMMMAPFLGEYSEGDYYQCDYTLPKDWLPNEHHVQELVKGLIATKGLSMKDRTQARRDNLEFKRRDKIIKAAEMMEEGLNSAQWGRIQQSVSGPKNTFQSPEDWERERDAAQKALGEIGLPKGFKLPKRGTKMFQPEN